jgi:hypothetical protein
MNVRRIGYLVAGIVLTAVIAVSAIAIYNIAVYKIPLSGQPAPSGPGSDKYLEMGELVNITPVAPDDPVREHLITEDQAWNFAWAFLHDKEGITIFLPMRKGSVELEHVVDNTGTEYFAWRFYLDQEKLPFTWSLPRIAGGLLFIDAANGEVLKYSGFG